MLVEIENKTFSVKKLERKVDVSEILYIDLNDLNNCKVGKQYPAPKCKPGKVCYPVEGAITTECEKCEKFCQMIETDEIHDLFFSEVNRNFTREGITFIETMSDYSGFNNN